MAIDESALMNVISRAEAGGELVIGFLGGSITQGSLSSSADTCYAALVYQWWVRSFPRAAFHYVNAGIGGTDSLYGAAVSIKDGVYSKILAGEYAAADLSPDGLHPNDKGHSLVAAEVIKYLESVREKAAGKACSAAPMPMKQAA